MSVTVTLSTVMEKQLEEPVRKTVLVRRASGTVDLGDDIRNGIPKLSTLAKWKAGFRAQERLEAQEKRRLEKGKQVETVWNGLNGRPTPTGLPCNGVVEHCADNTRAPPTEDVAGSSSEKQQSGPGVFGLELPRPPLSRRKAPPVPSQPVEPPRRKAPPVPSQPVEPPSTSTVPVTVKFSKLERIRQMEFRSSKQVKAREIPLSKTEVEKLRTFSEFVGTPNQIALFGKQLPQCHRYAVQLELDGSKPQTYICIEGLRKNEDIRDFYAVMSQKKYRKYYEPWKICFRMVEVSKSAAPVSHGQDVEEVAALSQIMLRRRDLTLCGSLVKAKTRDGERISTVGGIIQIGSDLFALTTAHSHLASDSTSSTLAASSSPAQTLNDKDFPDAVENILVVSEDMDLHQENFKPAKVNWEDLPQVEEFITLKVYEDHRDDWCLIPLPQEYQLPNIEWSYKHNPPTVFTEVHTEYPGHLSVHSYIHSMYGHSSYPSFPGLVPGAPAFPSFPGLVAAAPSFLDGEQGPIEVWAVVFSNRWDDDFARGASGSWFFTSTSSTSTFGRPSVHVLGTAVARAPGKAFITLLSNQFDSISRSFPENPKPLLPDPLPMLLRAVKHFYATDRDRSDRLINLLFQILRHSSHPLPILFGVLQSALRAWDEDKIDRLKKLIVTSGPNLEATLQGTPGEAILDTSSSQIAQELALLYKRWKRARVHESPPAHMSALPALASSRVASPAAHRSRISPPTRHPPNIPQMTEVTETESRTETDDRHVKEASSEPFFRMPPFRGTVRDELEAQELGRDPGLSTSVRRNLPSIVLLFLGLAYLAGMGVGAWKLLTSDLSSKVKIGVGVGLIIFHLLGAIFFCLPKKRTT
ncbi:hypothetical protein QBC37DRAFT_390965 [Rhypophila decipiens]|uniref:Uncharacterized protein n=1 Tax=Rhypophila decipiens TaxID=261697 RepID=A0AAN6Y480_9PEZI|nr:hypothetical protein QBC37DRAFT_390965 [Rhypophila decipiens]